MNAWLIECAPPLGDTLYFCNDGDWCSNPNHAHKFTTAIEAQAKLTTMQNPLSMRIAEHEWPEDARCGVPLRSSRTLNCLLPEGHDGAHRFVDDDPTPWCHVCGAKRKVDCKCGPIAENE